MATETRLNQIVKGAPLSNIHTSPPAPLPPLTSTNPPAPASSAAQSQSALLQNDPYLSTLPSSPPQIYLNLLIHEASLRAQYTHLLSRRRLHTFFLLLLGVWNLTTFYFLFLRPREDGSGHGGSVYWVLESLEKVALLGGVFTTWLVWVTGQWDRGVKWPRRWIGTTNRGLRGFNLRVVIVRGPWVEEMLGHLSFLLPFGLWREAGGYSDWHIVEEANGRIVEEDLAPGGDTVKLLLLPKSFSPEFRENWDDYRADYWEKENERRAVLRARLRTQRREKAREAGGLMWWTGLWRLGSTHARKHTDLEKHPHGHQHAAGLLKDKNLANAVRRRSLMTSDDSNHSRQSSRSSRSSTPQIAEFDGSFENGGRARRGSSSASATARRKAREAGKGGGGSARNSMHLSPLTSVELNDAGAGGDATEKKERRRVRRTSSRPGTPGSDTSSDKTIGTAAVA